jgi:hypothetical protein
MTRIFLLLALCLPLVACSGLTPVLQTATPAAVPSSPSSAATCPSQDFNTFLHAFTDDVRYQKTFVADPLQSDSIDVSAVPEPRPVTKMVAASQLRFPLIPNAEQQIHDGLKMQRIVLNTNQISVKLTKKDTDYQITFFFKRISDCWQLYRIKNDSI